MINIPYVAFTGTLTGRLPQYSVGLRNQDMFGTLVYTAGPITGLTLAAVPDDIRQATMFLAAHFLSYRSNPVGAANIHQGEVTIEARLRGESPPKSLLVLDAETLLQPYAASRGK